MTLPPYTSSREDEERQLGSGSKLCRVGLCVLHCSHDSSLERDARVPARLASCCERRRPPEEAANNLDSNDEGETTMGMLRIISHRGDDRLLWNEQDARAGDTEALAALREVERIFAQERARGATAFRVEAGKPVEWLGQFDPQASQIVMVPRVVGG